MLELAGLAWQSPAHWRCQSASNRPNVCRTTLARWPLYSDRSRDATALSPADIEPGHLVSNLDRVNVVLTWPETPTQGRTQGEGVSTPHWTSQKIVAQ